MGKFTAEFPALIAAGALLFGGSSARAQTRGQTLDGEKLFQLYNSTSTPPGYRRHLERVFDKNRARIAWSTPMKASALIHAQTGGTVHRSDGAAVVVAPGALPRDLVISISIPAVGSLAEESAEQAKKAAAGLMDASDAVQFGPQGVALSSGVAVVLPYNPLSGLEENSLRVYAWNRAASKWVALHSTADHLNHMISAAADSFTVFQVLGRRPWVPNSR